MPSLIALTAAVKRAAGVEDAAGLLETRLERILRYEERMHRQMERRFLVTDFIAAWLPQLWLAGMLGSGLGVGVFSDEGEGFIGRQNGRQNGSQSPSPINA